MYVIKRVDQGGGYVSKSGSSSSYTRNIRQMEKFETYEDADNNRCKGNEIVVSLDHLTGG